jgi:uncharacterized protein YndB with AHSA1/START domain
MNHSDLCSMLIGSALGIALGALPVLAARAAVTDEQPNGFAIEETAHIAAPPDKVYGALLQPRKWWNSAHTFSQNSANLSLDAKAGGCLCETLPDGGSALHAIVVVAQPARTLRLRGPFGPFQSQGVDGALTFTLKAGNGGTELVLNDNVGGYMQGGFGRWPQAADAMLADLVAHLKYYVETGKAMPPDKASPDKTS